MVNIMELKSFMKFSRNCATWTSKQHRPTALSTQFCKDYQDFFPRLVDKTIQQTQYIGHPYMKRILDKITKYYTRYPLNGEAMIYAYELLEKRENINDEKLHRAYCVACAMEMCQNYFYIQDDVYDKSVTRSGKKCWHLLPDASPLSINDCRILRSMTYEVLRQNVEKPMYSQLMNVFNEIWLLTEFGQHTDLMVSKMKGYDHFTVNTYRKLAQLKASYFSLIYPVHVAIVLSHKGSEEMLQFVSAFLNDYGMLIQAHNDFTDFMDYDESMSKKSNDDIRNGKCTWNAVTALQHMNNEDRKIFEQCYGSSDPQKIKKVILLYEKINLPKLFKEYQNSYCENFLQNIKGLYPDATISSEFFLGIFNFFQSYLSNTSRYYYI